MPSSAPFDWSAWRARMLLPPDAVNLNAGTLSPTPRPVHDAADALRRQLGANGTDFVWRVLPRRLAEARRRLGQFLRADPSDLLLLPNVTFALDTVIESLPLKPGDEVAMLDAEYGAMRLAWARRARRDGLLVREVPLPVPCDDPQEIVSRFEAALGPSTRAALLSHVTSCTGTIVSAAAICALLRRRGVLSIVDGAHAPGMLDLDLRDVDADFYGGNCHKWMMSAPGAGFLHVRREHKALLQPLVTSWGYDFDPARAEQDSRWGGTFWQRNLEYHGVVDRCAQATLPEAIDFGDAIGRERIRQRSAELAAVARDALGRVGLPCLSVDDPRLTGSLLIFDAADLQPAEARRRLWHEFRIECPITDLGKRRFLRVSLAWFNTPDEIERLAGAVAAIRGS